MSQEQTVFESTASYYDPFSKKWKTGIFTLNDKYFQFSDGDNQTLRIPLNTLSGLEKRQSSLIYAAIVVSVGSEKHWFASFPNRETLYNLLELFWREALLSKTHKTSPARPKTGSTDLGKDLLNLLHESETTLVDAANALSDQGKQIEETQTTVNNINSDLNVAEKVLSNMSFHKAIMKLGNITSSDHTDQQEPVKCFKVSYTFSDVQNESCLWNTGTLLIGIKITLVDERKVNQLSLNYNEVILSQVISHWKFCLVYSEDGMEKSCYIMCPQLSKLLKFLHSLPSLSNKVVYLNDTFPSSSSLASCSSPSTSGVLGSPLSASTKKLENEGFTSSSEQLYENSDVISDEDIQEISNMLHNLQALATEVNREQQEQMEKINSLLSDSEKTELRLKADTKKIKKLT